MARLKSDSVGGRHGRPPTESENPDPEPDPDSAAHTICLRLLTNRARTRAELETALAARNIPDAAAQRVLDRLSRVGLVDDAAFATDFVNSRVAERGLAGRELARQLRAKGVDNSIIDSALTEVDPDSEYRTARTLAERKLRSMSRLEPAVQTRRLAGLLARKGYSPALAFRVVREVVQSNGLVDFDPDAGLG